MPTQELTLPRPGRRALVRPWMAPQELPRHLACFLPFLLGNVLAYWESGRMDLGVFVVSLLAVGFLTNGTYLLKQSFGAEDKRAALVKGVIPSHHARLLATGSILVAILLGLVLQFGLGTGPITVPLGLLGLLVGGLLTATPVFAGRKGFYLVFIAAGQATLVLWAYYVHEGWSLLPLLVTLPWIVALPAFKLLQEVPGAREASGTRGPPAPPPPARASPERMAAVYGWLIGLALVSLALAARLLEGWLPLAALVPAFFLLRSVQVTLNGRPRGAKQFEGGTSSGLIGSLLIPLTLAAAFLASAVVRWYG